MAVHSSSKCDSNVCSGVCLLSLPPPPPITLLFGHYCHFRHFVACLTLEVSVSPPTSLLLLVVVFLSLAGCIIQYQQFVSSTTTSTRITWIGVGMSTGEELELEQLKEISEG